MSQLHLNWFPMISHYICCLEVVNVELLEQFSSILFCHLFRSPSLPCHLLSHDTIILWHDHLMTLSSYDTIILVATAAAGFDLTVYRWHTAVSDSTQRGQPSVRHKWKVRYQPMPSLFLTCIYFISLMITHRFAFYHYVISNLMITWFIQY